MNEDYPLKVLLELRADAVDEAERELASEVGRLNELIERREELGARRQRLIDKRHAREETFRQRRRDESVTGAEFAQIRLFLKGLDIDIEQLRVEQAHVDERVEGQTSVVDQRRDELAEAKAELEVVQRHRADWQADRERLKKRRQADAMDELGTMVWRGGEDGT